jgi:hypothetical protein
MPDPLDLTAVPTTDPLRSAPYDPKHDDLPTVVRRTMRRAMRDIAARQSGAPGFEERPVFRNAQTKEYRPIPQAELRALVLLRDATNAAIEAALTASRAEGSSWDRCGELMGMPEVNDEGAPRETRAYFMLADAGGAYWTCSTCGGFVTDKGPFEPHPVDREEGHTSGCHRHQEEIAAYRAERSDLADD